MLLFTALQITAFEHCKALLKHNQTHVNSYLRACTANLANVTVMELRLLGRPFGLLQLVLVKNGLFVGVHSRGRHHVAS